MLLGEQGVEFFGQKAALCILRTHTRQRADLQRRWLEREPVAKATQIEHEAQAEGEPCRLNGR